MNFDTTLFRCSGLGKIMTDARSKSEMLSETTKTFLTEVFILEKYGRKKDITNKYIEKGLAVEEDSITLFSRQMKTFFRKNEQKLMDDFICGTPDLFEGEEIVRAEKIIDIKSSYDIFTFWNARAKPLNKDYYWQLQGYMSLTGAKIATLAYCLVNTPDCMITDEKRKLQWKMNVIDDSVSTDFDAACKEIDRLCIYDDIPIAERVHCIDIPRNDADVARLHERILECRKYLKENFSAA